MADQERTASSHAARLALLARALTSELSAQEIVNIVVRQGVAGVDAEGGVLGLISGDAVVPVTLVGYVEAATRAAGPLRLELELPLTVAARDNVAVWVGSRRDAASRFPVMTSMLVSDSQAWAAIPLLRRGQPFGVLSLSFLTEHSFPEDERLFLRTLADMTAFALADLVMPDVEHSPSEGRLPMCAWCKKVREPNDEWVPIDDFLARRLEVRLTHGMCPGCFMDNDVELPLLPLLAPRSTGDEGERQRSSNSRRHPDTPRD